MCISTRVDSKAALLFFFNFIIKFNEILNIYAWATFFLCRTSETWNNYCFHVLVPWFFSFMVTQVFDTFVQAKIVVRNGVSFLISFLVFLFTLWYISTESTKLFVQSVHCRQENHIHDSWSCFWMWWYQITMAKNQTFDNNQKKAEIINNEKTLNSLEIVEYVFADTWNSFMSKVNT